MIYCPESLPPSYKDMQLSVIFLLVLLTAAAAVHARTYVPTSQVRRGPHDQDVHAVAVRVPKDLDPHKLAGDHGFRYAGQIIPGYHLFERPASRRNESMERLQASVEWLEEQTPLVRVKRTPPADPLWGQQWHLHGGTRYGDLPHLGDLEGLWDRGITGRGITIAVVDDGLQHRHPDIAPNYRPRQSRDVSYGRDDPTPHPRDGHGTAAAGTAAASRNAVCGVGVAPGAGLAGIRILAGYPTMVREAIGLSFECLGQNAIFSNSWGPPDDGLHVEGPGHIVKEAMEHCITQGRGGRGSIYVWAGGNGRSNGDDMNNDGYANSIYTVTVGAVTDQGRHAYYSEPGSCLLLSAPSSGGTRSISTTDLLGRDGAAAGDCTGRFGGTSAAAPMVAGIVALALQVNPRLGWRDVQHILVQASNRTDLGSVGWTRNGGGLWHSHDYGFGIPDAGAVVALARRWHNVPSPSTVYTSGVRNTTLSVRAANTGSTTWECPAGPQGSFYVEHVEVTVSLECRLGRGHAQLVLCAPSGTCSILARARPSDRETNLRDWTYTSVRHWSEGCRGTWTLKLANIPTEAELKRLTGTTRKNRTPPVALHHWNIRVHGYRVPGTY